MKVYIIATLLALMSLAGCTTPMQRATTAGNEVTANLSTAQTALQSLQQSLTGKHDVAGVQQVKTAIVSIGAAQTAEGKQQSADAALQKQYRDVLASFRYRAGGWVVGILWTIGSIAGLYGLSWLATLLFPAVGWIGSLWKVLTFFVSK